MIATLFLQSLIGQDCISGIFYFDKVWKNDSNYSVKRSLLHGYKMGTPFDPNNIDK